MDTRPVHFFFYYYNVYYIKGGFSIVQKKIAALLREGQLSDFTSCTAVAVFEPDAETWQLTSEIPYAADACTDPAEIRNHVRSLILELDDCSAVVARRLQGLPYHVFDRMGFQIFEAETLSDALLSGILADIADTGAVAAPAETPTAPVASDEHGRYALDLIALQEQHPEVSSKKALRPFLQSTPFFELHLRCSHMPPWLEVDLQTMRRVRCATESQPDGTLHVTISRTSCNL